MTAALEALAKLQKELGTPDADIHIVSSRDFIAGFVPPDYLIDGILQRRFIYSLTAPTGSGKTALALLLAAHVGQGKAVEDHAVELGRVLILAGENPDDIRMRWIAMAELTGFDANTIEVHFIAGVFDIDKFEERIREEVKALGGVDVVNCRYRSGLFPW